MKNSYLFILIFCLFPIQITRAESVDAAWLKQIGSPEATWSVASGVTQIKHLQVEIRNLGSQTAEDIAVSAILPGGQSVQLKGPQTLEKNKTGAYINDGVANTAHQGSIKVLIECSNCADVKY